MLGCGAFDVEVLNKFEYPAARVFGVATVEDLLNGEIRDVNQAAQDRGIQAGMSGREALALI